MLLTFIFLFICLLTPNNFFSILFITDIYSSYLFINDIFCIILNNFFVQINFVRFSLLLLLILWFDFCFSLRSSFCFIDWKNFDRCLDLFKTIWSELLILWLCEIESVSTDGWRYHTFVETTLELLARVHLVTRIYPVAVKVIVIDFFSFW